MTEETSGNKAVNLIKKFILIILSMVPLIFLVGQINKYKVDMPVWDQWEFVPVLEKTFEQNLTFNDLW